MGAAHSRAAPVQLSCRTDETEDVMISAGPLPEAFPLPPRHFSWEFGLSDLISGSPVPESRMPGELWPQDRRFPDRVSYTLPFTTVVTT